MNKNLNEEDVILIKSILKKKNISIVSEEIRNALEKIVSSQKIFPLSQQRALLVRLLHIFQNTEKKEVIILDELIGKKKLPATFILGVLAQDWQGMSNSILRIINQICKNVLFIKAFTVNSDDYPIGIVIISFKINSLKEYDKFEKNSKQLIKYIKEASRGSISKKLFLDDETIKFEIHNDIVKYISENFKNEELDKLIGENSEVLRFISSRSSLYLAERKIKDLAELIVSNYKFIKKIRNGENEEILKIKNFETKREKLTGITFLCKELSVSIEDFLKTLNFIVPDNTIKHHKSFVTNDGILVYRIEIVDRNGKPLDSSLIKTIEYNLEKLILSSMSKKFSKVKTIGGFEHFARAIIPFLMMELKKTNITQVFINANKKTDFSLETKLIIVSYKKNTGRFLQVIGNFEKTDGIDITSFIPPKLYNRNIEIDLIKLNINLIEFKSFDEIFIRLKTILSKYYGEIRDFDQGFREIDMKILTELMTSLKDVDPNLIRDIFYNFDELYRVEINFNILKSSIRLCSDTIHEISINDKKENTLKYINLDDCDKTILCISYHKIKNPLTKILNKLKNQKIYSTRVTWDHRVYYIIITSHDNKQLSNEFIKSLKPD